ncbi:hypothetical protein ACLOJK_015252 [Asimina triloba]
MSRPNPVTFDDSEHALTNVRTFLLRRWIERAYSWPFERKATNPNASPSTPSIPSSPAASLPRFLFCRSLPCLLDQLEPETHLLYPIDQQFDDKPRLPRLSWIVAAAMVRPCHLPPLQQSAAGNLRGD